MSFTVQPLTLERWPALEGLFGRAKVAATPGNRLVVWPGTAVSTG